MIEHVYGNMLEELDDSDAYIVVPINAMGTMGAGLAKHVRIIVPEVHRAYQHTYGHGSVLKVEERAKIIRTAQTKRFSHVIFFCSKLDWRDPSPAELVKENLMRLKAFVIKHEIKAFSMPLVGSGLGELIPEVVREWIDETFKDWDGQLKVYLGIRPV